VTAAPGPAGVRVTSKARRVDFGGCGPAPPSSRVGNLKEMKDSSMPQPRDNPQTDCAHHQQHSVHSARIRTLL
jgi:hypothetical protein